MPSRSHVRQRAAQRVLGASPEAGERESPPSSPPTVADLVLPATVEHGTCTINSIISANFHPWLIPGHGYTPQ